MYTPKENQVEDVTNPNWELGLNNIVKTIKYIQDNQQLHRKLDNNLLNWKFSGSKEYPSITICMYEIEILTPVYSVKNHFGLTPIVKNNYPSTEQLIEAIIDEYENHTRYELKGNR